MPWATNGQIHTDHVPGGIEITEAQYQQAIEGVINGKLISIDGGFSLIGPPKAPEPEPVPEPEVPLYPPLTPVDFKLGMLTLNITPDQIDDVIENMPEPDRTIAKIYWTSARQFLRDDPLIEEVAAILGKTSDEINTAWRYASGT
jgi:hypothetical protein|nr:hypothetical protein [Neorhizobium tomejilense]